MSKDTGTASHSKTGTQTLYLGGVALDVSQYITRHPGGRTVLQKYIDSRKDAKDAFERVGHSDAAVALMRSMRQTSDARDVPKTPVVAALSPNFARLSKLFTHEDPLGAHKLCGLAALLHFGTCYYYLLGTKFASFNAVWWMMPVHALLALLGLRFPVERYRIEGTQNMTTEQVYHTVVFSSRSILIFYVSEPFWRVVVVLLHHLAADWVTRTFHEPSNGTTIRGGIADKWVPQWLLTFRNYYAGMAQYGATAALVNAAIPCRDAAMLSLIPIQLGAFVNTLTKKHILGSFGHGVIYGGALAVAYVYMAVRHPSVLVIMAACLLARKVGVNKYILILLLGVCPV